MCQEEQHKISLECKRNPKKFWQYVNKKTRSNTGVSDLHWTDLNGKQVIAENDSDKAAALQGFFCSVYTDEPDGDFDTLDNLSNNIHTKMSAVVITQDNVYRKLCNLNISKSPGPDMLHPRVLYECRDVIVYPLFLIYSKSLQSEKIPLDWKLAEVTAIFKKGLKSDRANYRPVSLTSVCCKLLESLIRDHIMTYLLENDLLSHRQYGFIKGRSTMLQLLHMFDKWTEYLEGGGQKAFDKVPHRRLINYPNCTHMDCMIVLLTGFLSS